MYTIFWLKVHALNVFQLYTFHFKLNYGEDTRLNKQQNEIRLQGKRTTKCGLFKININVIIFDLIVFTVLQFIGNNLQKRKHYFHTERKLSD